MEASADHLPAAPAPVCHSRNAAGCSAAEVFAAAAAAGRVAAMTVGATLSPAAAAAADAG
jgi:hypothetical protein